MPKGVAMPLCIVVVHASARIAGFRMIRYESSALSNSARSRALAMSPCDASTAAGGSSLRDALPRLSILYGVAIRAEHRRIVRKLGVVEHLTQFERNSRDVVPGHGIPHRDRVDHPIGQHLSKRIFHARFDRSREQRKAPRIVFEARDAAGRRMLHHLAQRRSRILGCRHPVTDRSVEIDRPLLGATAEQRRGDRGCQIRKRIGRVGLSWMQRFEVSMSESALPDYLAVLDDDDR